MTPLLFMGQEWAASTPFLFFTDHDAELGRAGHRPAGAANLPRFAAFSDAEPRPAIPDPQARTTSSARSCAWDEVASAPHARVLALYRALLALRAQDPVLAGSHARSERTATSQGELLVVRRRGRDGLGSRVLLANFGATGVRIGAAPWLPAEPRTVFCSGAADTEMLAQYGAVILASDS